MNGRRHSRGREEVFLGREKTDKGRIRPGGGAGLAVIGHAISIS